MEKKFELLNETENYCLYYCYEDTTMQVTDREGTVLAEGDHDDNWLGLCPAMQETLDKADSEGLFDGTWEKMHISDIARAMGRIGGKAKSEAKAKAARANGAKGGRPRKAREEV